MRAAQEGTVATLESDDKDANGPAASGREIGPLQTSFRTDLGAPDSGGA
jgi:hypothetical protein